MKNNKWPILCSMFLIMVFSFVLSLPSHAMPPLDLEAQPAAPDYAVPEGWLVKPVAPVAPVDVFYVYPTVIFNDTNQLHRPSKKCFP
jgi:hypothetical protein